MSLAKGPFGIEYNPRPLDDGSPAVRRIVAVVVLVAAVSLCTTLVRRWRARPVEEPPAPAPAQQPASAANGGGAAAPANPGNPAPSPAPGASASAPPPAPPPVAQQTEIDRRPPRVRNLLLKLEKAEAAGDVVMCVSTIEQLRALPGQPAADIDDRLARRLGELNVRWLFELRNPQWVETVKVKSGDNATRIVREHGSTLASMKRLNGAADLNRLRAGATVAVMRSPRFNLVVHRRTRTADLQLNGKFFKRYDLRDAVSGEPGAHRLQGQLRQLLAEQGVWFNLADRDELETLMPRGSDLTISEM